MDTAPAMNNATSSMANVTTTESATLEIQRIDVKDTTISINGLKKDVLYELVVKAGNVYGAYSYLPIASLAQPGLICPLLFSYPLLPCPFPLQVPACSPIRLGLRWGSNM